MFAYCLNNPIRFIDPAGMRVSFMAADGGGPCGFASSGSVFGNTRAGGNSGVVMRRIKDFLNNTDENIVLDASFISFYKGVLVIRINGDRSGYFGVIFLTYETNSRVDAQDLVRHEYGHAMQMKELGVVTYFTNIFLPSSLEWGSNSDYYSREVEVTADILGGVESRTHSSEHIVAGFNYLEESKSKGIIAWATIK